MPRRTPAAVLAVCLFVLPVFGQEASPQFEVATLKLSPPPTADSLGVNLGTFQKGRFTFGNVTLNDAILFAFDLPSKELLVGLDWSDSARYDAEGLAPPETPQPQLRLMVRRLLEERLHLVVRREQRTIRHLALVVARDGRKFKDAVESPLPTIQARGRINHKRMSMRLLASLLSRFEQQLVVDQTGLDGFYEVGLEWAPDMVGAPPDLTPVPVDRPSLSTALHEQLGLRLEGRREPLEVVVIESASRIPEPN